MKNNLYVDFHVLQTVPPSCVNRDDVGSPKTAVYGGVRRARVSSQAWKRAVRLAFKDIFDGDNAGFRTKNVADLITKEIMADDADVNEEKARKLAEDALKAVGAKGDKGKDVLFFISEKQVAAIAKTALVCAQEKVKDKEKKARLEVALNQNPSIDIALFGRMAASNPMLNSDATCQVAHAISTHAVSNEYDYFTAVDDCAPEDNAGAGHIGTTEFNSSTLYRYATINVRALKDMLSADEVNTAVTGFAEAFITSMPTGKQNTFANRTLPDMVYVTVRSDQPVNLSGAFEKPVTTTQDGYVEKSINALNDYAAKVYDDFVDVPDQSWQIGSQEAALGKPVKLKALYSALSDAVHAYVNDDEDA